MRDQQDGIGHGALRRMIRLLPATLLLVATPAPAADRHWGIGSFERLRVEAPVEVRVIVGAPPRASASAPTAAALDRVTVEASGTTLVVRRGASAFGGAGAFGGATGNAAPAVLTLSTPRLQAATLLAGGPLTVEGARGERLDLSTTSGGVVNAAGVDAGTLNATLVGAGTMTLAGKARVLRLVTTGPGTIDAAALTADDLTVTLDGTGSTHARARYTARVTSTGLGAVTVEGNPKCVVRAGLGGPVRCGKPAP